ncbi:MAG: hypothetical protein M3179_00125 [Actinomycetota bacterium]|nr:hypothetical protein [Actinomycetota bacterium]
MRILSVVGVARFASEDDRRRFYGEDVPSAASEEIEFGRDWKARSDPAAVYSLRWVKDTRQIYVVRRLPPPPGARHDLDDLDDLGVGDDLDPLDEPDPALPVSNMDFGVEVLGWAEDLSVLEQALDGWEAQVRDDDGLEWVRQRLGAAAAETDRRRRTSSGGWWPGFGRGR